MKALHIFLYTEIVFTLILLIYGLAVIDNKFQLIPGAMLWAFMTVSWIFCKDV